MEHKRNANGTLKSKVRQRKILTTNNHQLTTFIIMSDINIKITDREGVTHEVVAPTDMSMNLMEIIRSYELAEEGTIGVCGGMAMCASCQCYVLNDVISLERNPDEEAMLWEAYHVKDNSRLGCQIPITEALEGLEIEIAPEQ